MCSVSCVAAALEVPHGTEESADISVSVHEQASPACWGAVISKRALVRRGGQGQVLVTPYCSNLVRDIMLFKKLIFKKLVFKKMVVKKVVVTET